MWEDFARALALMLIFEGMLPFLYPGRWRSLVATMAMTKNKQLRLMGFISMLIGLALLYWAR